MIIYTSKVKKIAKENGKMVGRDYLEALDKHVRFIIEKQLSAVDAAGKKIMKADLFGPVELKGSAPASEALDKSESRTGDDVQVDDSAEAGIVPAEED